MGDPIREAVWGDDVGVTWASAPADVKAKFAAVRLYWFFRMIDSGGPDGGELDTLVYDEARTAAEWYGPLIARAAGMAESDDL